MRTGPHFEGMSSLCWFKTYSSPHKATFTRIHTHTNVIHAICLSFCHLCICLWHCKDANNRCKRMRPIVSYECYIVPFFISFQRSAFAFIQRLLLQSAGGSADSNTLSSKTALLWNDTLHYSIIHMRFATAVTVKLPQFLLSHLLALSVSVSATS